ncbi:MAG: hypothetical protein ABIZ95_14065 [Pyrinomonadaceae bacterium]
MDYRKCNSCGLSNLVTESACFRCGAALPAESAGFYQARLVPDSDFRRAQQGAEGPAPAGIKNSMVTIFAVFNLIFSLFALGGIGFWLLVVMTSVFQNDPKVGDIAVGSAFFIIPNIVAFILFLPAAIGLMKRKNWGYYFHLCAAVLAGFSCVGLLYTIPALYFAFQPGFKRDFPSQ